jgi:uncharacterized protein YjbJ (UPF0337 family)
LADNKTIKNAPFANLKSAVWGKIPEQELSAIKDGMVSQVQTKYGLNKEQALRDIDAVLMSRR